jgi:hypothetical protein
MTPAWYVYQCNKVTVPLLQRSISMYMSLLAVLQYAALASKVTMTSEIEATVAGEHWPQAGHALLPADEPTSAAAATDASTAAAASAAAALASAQVCCELLAEARPVACCGTTSAAQVDAASDAWLAITHCLGGCAQVDSEVPAAASKDMVLISADYAAAAAVTAACTTRCLGNRAQLSDFAAAAAATSGSH